ncbi:MAG: M20/M25/M40 family metallo-hydrolase [Treponemataceae bacterium]
MEKQERVIQRFLEYVQIDSPTKDEKNFKERLKADLEKLGLQVYEDNAGEKVGSNSGNLIAKLKGTGDKTILFSSHMDTVSPGRGVKPVVKDGVIYSDGTTVLGADDKAGVSAIVEMLNILVEEKIPHHNIEAVFTVHEEGGLLGSKNLDYSNLKADFGIVLDSGGGAGKTVLQGPAQNKINVKFKGVSAHAGTSPEAGVSAIQIAAEAIYNMKLLRIDEETTANVGYIHGGGATNIVTDCVEIYAEARSLCNEKLKKQTEHMVDCVKKAQAKYGLEAEISVSEAYKAFEIKENSIPAQKVKKACEKLGFKFTPTKSGGGSDTNNYNINKIPSVNLGIGMSNCHRTDEYIKIQDILDCTKLIVEIARV